MELNYENMVSIMGQREGYLLIDHRASPGLPEDVARKTGIDPKHAGEGKIFEAATLTCSHCKIAVVKNPLRVRERAYCPKCDHYICDLCAVESRRPDYDHLPFDKMVDLGLSRAAKEGNLGSPRKLLIPQQKD